jgi:predicted outer membrane protein
VRTVSGRRRAFRRFLDAHAVHATGLKIFEGHQQHAERLAQALK